MAYGSSRHGIVGRPLLSSDILGWSKGSNFAGSKSKFLEFLELMELLELLLAESLGVAGSLPLAVSLLSVLLRLMASRRARS